MNPMMGKADMYQFSSCGWKMIARKWSPVLRNSVELGARARGGAGDGIAALREHRWPEGNRNSSFRASSAALSGKPSGDCEIIREISACASPPALAVRRALLVELPFPKGGERVGLGHHVPEPAAAGRGGCRTPGM